MGGGVAKKLLTAYMYTSAYCWNTRTQQIKVTTSLVSW